MPKNSRLKQIESYLMKHGSVDVCALSQELHVSEMTIRRDLNSLASQGKIIRIHGGAIIPKEHYTGDIYMDSRSLIHTNEKKAIAREAVKQLQSGDNIFVDDSSTVAAMAEFIPHNMQLTITTNSMSAALEFNKLPNIEVICLGGLVSKTTKSVTGPLVTDLLRSMHFKTAFLGIPYISADGIISTHSFDEFSIKKTVIQQSRNSILLIDSSKICDEIMHIQLARADEFDLIITNHGIRDDFMSFCINHGISLQVVRL